MRAKNILCFLILSFSFVAKSFDGSPKAKSPNATRISFGPAYGFYLINTKHAKLNGQNVSFNLGVRREVKTDRDYKTYFAFGLDYFLHGLNYQSYYFKPDTIKLYDKSLMNYKYSLFIHELNAPLQLKFLFKRANNSLYSPYVSIGYHLRYLLFSNLHVSQNNKTIKKDFPDVAFKNPLITKHMNAFVSASVGWQKNNLTNSKNSFFVELNFKYGFSQYSFEKNYSATSMYINGNHLCMLLGFKY